MASVATAIANLSTGSGSTTQSAEVIGNTALNAIPVVGGTLAAIASGIESIFGGAHSAAVAKQAASMQKAVPAFLTEINSVMNGLNAGAISETQAISYLQQAQTLYYQNVASFIKKGGACKPATCFGKPSNTWAGCAPGPCNEGCGVGCGLVESAVTGLTAIIQAGKGSYTVQADHASSDISWDQVTFTYSRPTLETSIDRKILGALGLSTTATGGSSTIGNLELGFIVLALVIVALLVGHGGKGL
jgi:hypothetical protein